MNSKPSPTNTGGISSTWTLEMSLRGVRGKGAAVVRLLSGTLFTCTTTAQHVTPCTLHSHDYGHTIYLL